MSKQRRDSLARSGWYPIKTYNHAIYELEIEGVIEIRKRMGRTRGQAAPLISRT